ncbi:MAG: hypothetical protein R2728_04265 [Chitinophagales bacterium]
MQNRVNTSDSAIVQANKSIVALQLQLERQRTIDSIQNLERDQRIAALESTSVRMLKMIHLLMLSIH